MTREEFDGLRVGESVVTMTNMQYKQLTTRMFRLGKEFANAKTESERLKIMDKAYDWMDNPDRIKRGGRKSINILD